MTRQDEALATILYDRAPTAAISILTKEGDEVAVKAALFGPLAVHKSLNAERGYTVTHLNTKGAVRKDLTVQQAVILAERLKSLDWNFTDPACAKKLSASVAAAAVSVLKP